MYGIGIIAILKQRRLRWTTQWVVVQSLQSLMQDQYHEQQTVLYWDHCNLKTERLQWTTHCVVVQSLQSLIQYSHNEPHNAWYWKHCNLSKRKITMSNTMCSGAISAILHNITTQTTTQCMALGSWQS